MTAWDLKHVRNVVLASGLGLSLNAPLLAQPVAPPAEPDTPEAPRPAAPEAPAEPVGLFDQGDENLDGQDVAVDSLGQIDITVKDLEITKVLQLLSIQSQRNIVASRNVSGKVSADLYGVSFHEALDAILTPNGYGYEEKGNFIYVYTAAELEERKNLLRKTETKIVRLNYLSSTDAAAFLTPLLSQNGSITASASPDAGILPSESDAGENSFAHPDTLVVRDFEENIAEITDILGRLDVRPQQVLIEATILQAALTEQNAFGIDFAVFANFDALDFANPLNAVDNLINGTGPAGETGTALQATPGNTTTGANNVKIGLVGSDAAVFLRALDSVTDNTVLARPNILVLNKQKADLLVGQRLGYLSTTVTDTSETQTIEFLDIGTQLTVRPWISDEGTIRLELRPSVSDGTTRLEGGFIIPDQTTQELVTNIIVESGQTVVLGGLFKEDTQVGRSQLPFLGDIPIIGAAFKGQDDLLQRSEVIFMVKTTIMDNTTLTARGDEALKRIEDARIGIRDGMLPFSTDKMVSSYLLKARQAHDAGDDQKALWNVNLALHLSPTSGDALRLKEEITGEEFAYFDRSLFQGMTDDLIDTEIERMNPGMNDMDDNAPLGDGEDITRLDVLESDLFDAPTDKSAAAQPAEPESRFSDAVVVQIPMVEQPAPAPGSNAPGSNAPGSDAAPVDVQTAEAPAAEPVEDGEFVPFSIDTEVTEVDTMPDEFR